LFQAKADEISNLKSISKTQKAWLSDYIRASSRLRHLAVVSQPTTSAPRASQEPSEPPSEPSDDSLNGGSESGKNGPGQYPSVDSTPILQDEEPINVDKLTKVLSRLHLSERIVKPEIFDGVKPNPRHWLDNMEQAKRINRLVRHIYFTAFSSLSTGLSPRLVRRDCPT
jgi:hypothetical protein